MCLAIPMKVTKIEGSFATAELSGTKRKINIEFIPTLKLGDYCLVHAGFAIQKVDEKEAKETLNIVKEINQK